MYNITQKKDVYKEEECYLCFFFYIFKNSCCLNFCKKSLLRWRIVVNLAPCSCAGAVARWAGCLLSRTPRWACLIGNPCPPKLHRRRIVAKHDIASHCVHRLDHSRICPLANLYCGGAPAGRGAGVHGAASAPCKKRSCRFFATAFFGLIFLLICVWEPDGGAEPGGVWEPDVVPVCGSQPGGEPDDGSQPAEPELRLEPDSQLP